MKKTAVVVQKRLEEVEKKEKRWVEHALKNDKKAWYEQFTSRIPKIIVNNLQLAFSRGFELLFVNGTGIMNKICPKEGLAQDFDINNYAFDVKGTKKSLKQVSAPARNSQRANMALTVAEGFGMGITGMGIPDIPVFLGLLLRGVYEIAATFGIDYNNQDEKYFILLLMETVVLHGNDKVAADYKVDDYINQLLSEEIKPYNFKDQLRRTANAYAADTLFLKFVQGAPIIGLVGGLYNPVYYKRLSDYARLKYEKRYLLAKTIELKKSQTGKSGRKEV